MEKLSVEEIKKRVKGRQTFDAVADDYSFSLKIDKYVPYISAAIHNGNQFRKSLWENCKHTAYERWFEEDPATKYFISDQPIVIAGRDSRFEYDLNRAPDKAVYVDAWGKQLWHQPLSEEEKNLSLAKHGRFYEVVECLTEALTEDFGKIFVYDTHSYNWRRWERKVPFINIGTANIDREKYKTEVDDWLDLLHNIKIPGHTDTGVEENDVFQGNGYFLKFITDAFPNALVLATEFSKLYCHEYDWILYPEIIEAVKESYQKQIEVHTRKYLSLGES